MASEHYPVDRGPTELVRELADAILADLRVTPTTKAELASSYAASPASIQRAIGWLRQCGIELRVDRHGPTRWILCGDRVDLPAHAMSRIDLLDKLRDLLGGDTDPLERIRQMVEAQKARAWMQVAIGSWARRAHGLVWRLDYSRHLAELGAMAIRSDGVADVCRRQDGISLMRGDFLIEEVKAWADWRVASQHVAVAKSLEPMSEQEAASW